MEIIQKADFAILDAIQKIRCDFTDRLMVFITHLGDKGKIWLLAAMILLCIRRYRKCAVTMLMGLLMQRLTGNLIIKNIVRRSRPCWISPIADMLIKIPKDYSFPSGHTMSCFTAMTILMLWDKRLGIPAMIVGCAIAFSRLYLYVHFPTDVIGGAVLGILLGLGTYRAAEKYLFRPENT